MAEKLKEIKAVVTGGAGFIGSHIVEECLKRGWQVTIIDNLSTGRLENIQHLLTPSPETGTSKLVTRNTSVPFPDTQNSKLITQNFPVSSSSLSTQNSLLNTQNSPVSFVHGNILDLALLKRVFSGAHYVFHLAAFTSVPGSIKDPQAAHETNQTGTLNVLMAAGEAGVRKVVFSSSAAVYGDTPELYKKECALPCPQSPYAVTKLAGEYYCLIWEEIYKLPTVCLRYFNVFGPRQRPDSEYAAVIPKFIQKAKEDQPPVIFGDGKQTRDFVYVKDVAAVNILAAESQVTGIYNIGSAESTTINQLSRLILRLMNKENIQPVYQAERPGDIKDSLADISAAKSFGYKPEYTLEEGLKETISGFSLGI